jgi:predicted RNA-binding Zn ribbon-like protein
MAKTKTKTKKKKPGIVAQVAERVLAAVRDAQGTDTFKAPQDTSVVVGQSEELSEVDEAAARKEWALGALGHREAQLKKFHGRTETMAHVMEQERQQIEAFNAEVESGQAWFLNDGDPLRFHEEPVNIDVQAVLADLALQLKHEKRAQDDLAGARTVIASIDAEIAAAQRSKEIQRGVVRVAMATMKIAQQRIERLRKDLSDAGVKEPSGTRPEDQMDASS